MLKWAKSLPGSSGSALMAKCRIAASGKLHMVESVARFRGALSTAALSNHPLVRSIRTGEHSHQRTPSRPSFALQFIPLMLNVALASADRKFARELRLQLVGWGYRPWMADPEEPVIEQLRDRGADLLLFDFTAPPSDTDAVNTVRALKNHVELKHIPVVALVDVTDAIQLDFTVGLEDFLVRGDAFEELHARIKFVLWRLSKVDYKDTVKAGGLVMNLASYQVTVRGEQIDLTYKEFELLRFLLSHRGRVFSRDALLRHVWGDEYLGGTRTVDVHIRRLRAKIGSEFDELIQTVRNVGYKLIEENKA